VYGIWRTLKEMTLKRSIQAVNRVAYEGRVRPKRNLLLGALFRCWFRREAEARATAYPRLEEVIEDTAVASMTKILGELAFFSPGLKGIRTFKGAAAEP